MVLSCRSKDLIQRTSVAAPFQLNFIWQAKDSTPSRHKGRLTPKERPQSVLASSFYMFVSSPTLSLPYANWASQEGGMFVSPEVLIPVCGFSFILFLLAFPLFVFKPPPFWTPFSYSNYLTYLFKMLDKILTARTFLEEKVKCFMCQ